MSFNEYLRQSHEWIYRSLERKIHAIHIRDNFSALFQKSFSHNKNHREEIQKYMDKIDSFFSLKQHHPFFYQIFENMLFKRPESNEFGSQIIWKERVRPSLEILLDTDSQDSNQTLRHDFDQFISHFLEEVDRENSFQKDQIIQLDTLLSFFIVATDLLFIFGLVGIYFGGIEIATRIKYFTRGISQMVQQKDYFELSFEGQDEISELSERFNSLMSQLKETSISKGLLENILASMSDMIFIISSEGKVIHHNKAIQTTLGYEENDLEQLEFTDLFVDHLFDFTAHNQEVSIKKKSGEIISCFISGHILHSELEGEEELNQGDQYLFVIRDMTEYINMQRQLNEEKSKSIHASKMATLGEMAGGVAHEINNPMTVIDGMAKMIRRYGEMRPIPIEKILSSAEKIEKHSSRVSKIVRGLRTFSRDGSDDPFEEISVKHIIEDSLELCQERILKKGIKLIDFDHLPEDLQIEGQMIPLTQVFINLLNNAHDAILEVELEQKWIQMEIEDVGDFVQISIIDSGPGIPKEIREKILQPFFTTKEVGKGTGLGLGIVQGIIQKHKGNLIIDPSCPNTKFVITLPKKQVFSASSVA